MTDNKNKIFVTSALPYVNAIPHLGNLIGSTLSGDVFSRFKKLMGNDVLYLCGTDNYGTTTMVKAREEKLSCEEICEKYNALHKKVYDLFNIKFDVWGKSSTETQTQLAQEIFLNLYKNDYLEEKTISQMFCDKCNMFLADRYIKGICYHPECKDKNSITNGDQCDTCQKFIDVDKIIKPYCYICNNEPHLKDTAHLYLKLGKFTDALRDYYFKNNKCEMSDVAFHVTKDWLDKGLDSRCITRDLSWGTPVPWEYDNTLKKYKDKTFYVWFDAPIAYMSILANARVDWKDWVTGSSEVIQFYGIDNVPFHTIMYSATLIGEGNRFNLPTQINSTNYLTFEGKKFSKSNKIGVFGDQIENVCNKLGINEDYFRYYLIYVRPESDNSNFSWKEFCDICSADLVNNYGNLVNRCITMSKKYCGGTLKLNKIYDKYFDDLINLIKKYIEQMNNGRMKESLTTIMTISTLGNCFLDNTKPWLLSNIKKDDPEINDVLSFCTLIAYCATYCISPIIPRSTEYILKYINYNNDLNILQEVDNLKNLVGCDIKFLSDEYKLPFLRLKFNEIKEKLNL